MNNLTFFVAVLGSVATLWCLLLFWFFIRSRHQIGRAVGYDKLAESLFSGITVFFAYFAQGIWTIELSDWFVALLRASAFIVSIGASIHLTSAVLKIIEKEENGE